MYEYNIGYFIKFQIFMCFQLPKKTLLKFKWKLKCYQYVKPNLLGDTYYKTINLMPGSNS